MLKEQAVTRKDAQSVQRKIISEEHALKPKLRVKENEHAPSTADDTAEIRESKESKEDNWTMSTCAPTDYFCKNQKNVEKRKESRNRNICEQLKDNDDDEKHEDKKRIRKRSQQHYL